MIYIIMQELNIDIRFEAFSVACELGVHILTSG
jgi:hypothetical protein